MSKILITGRTNSGKSESLRILKTLDKNLNLTETPLIVDSFNSLGTILVNSDDIRSYDHILIIDRPTLFCYPQLVGGKIDTYISKEGDSFFSNIDKEERILKYLTEIPTHTIIKNNRSLDTLKVRIKDFYNKFLKENK
jgi:RNase adaptor protein for sRNA GlmZ degradation